jgi:SAM-dependent methyltransferase
MSDEVFGDIYASAYDALYEDKDYAAECDVIEAAFASHGHGPLHSVLDLGYEVVGIDRSEAMLALAEAKADASAPGSAAFRLGDVRDLDLGRQFDAVVMMFAVLGYQLGNADVLATLQGARTHLRPGGVLLFDVWYGPAVVRIGPGQRVKVVEADGRTVVRAAHGELDERHGLCGVSYRLWDLTRGAERSEVVESHAMRFFYPMELELFLEQSGFELRRLSAFPNVDVDASPRDWSALVVAT